MNILAIGAHFDDIELGCGGSLLKWHKVGHHINLFVATKSGYQDSHNKPIRSEETARKEGLIAAKFLNAKLYEGNFETFKLEFSEELNATLLKVANETQPDLILTHWSGDVHHDHQMLAKASLHSLKHTPKILTYRSNWHLSQSTFEQRYFVDISSFIEKKVELIKIHHSEFNRTKNMWEKFVREEAGVAGLKSGCEHAEGFEIVKFLD